MVDVKHLRWMGPALALALAACAGPLLPTDPRGVDGVPSPDASPEPAAEPAPTPDAPPSYDGARALWTSDGVTCDDGSCFQVHPDALVDPDGAVSACRQNGGDVVDSCGNRNVIAFCVAPHADGFFAVRPFYDDEVDLTTGALARDPQLWCPDGQLYSPFGTPLTLHCTGDIVLDHRIPSAETYDRDVTCRFRNNTYDIQAANSDGDVFSLSVRFTDGFFYFDGGLVSETNDVLRNAEFNIDGQFLNANFGPHVDDGASEALPHRVRVSLDLEDEPRAGFGGADVSWIE